MRLGPVLALVTSLLMALAPAPADAAPRKPAKGKLLVQIINVGQGDSIYVQGPTGKNLLIDGGDDRDHAGPAVLEFLANHGVEKLDAVLLTHPHDDHFGGLLQIVGNIKIGEFLYGTPVSAPRYDKLKALLKENKVPARHVSRGESLTLGGGVKAEVLAAGPAREPSAKADGNAWSVVVRLAYGSTSYLLTGDLPTAIEKELVASGVKLQADVLKVGHHGSRTASGEAFLEAVKPQWALISVGRGNQFGHPHKEAMARLKVTEAQLVRTDRDGSIMTSSDGTTLEVGPDTVVASQDHATKRGLMSMPDLESLANGPADAVGPVDDGATRDTDDVEVSPEAGAATDAPVAAPAQP